MREAVPAQQPVAVNDAAQEEVLAQQPVAVDDDAQEEVPAQQPVAVDDAAQEEVLAQQPVAVNDSVQEGVPVQKPVAPARRLVAAAPSTHLPGSRRKVNEHERSWVRTDAMGLDGPSAWNGCYGCS